MLEPRINRIVGQLRGVERMIGEKRDCSDILQQISAIKKAIDGLSREVVVTDVCKYVAKGEASRHLAQVVERVISM